MDNVKIKPSMLSGRVVVPPSKSVTHRAVIAAALSGGECVIDNVAMSEDIAATLRGVLSLGCTYTYDSEKGKLKFKESKDKKNLKEIEIDCGESGSTLRFLMPIALVLGCDVKFICHGRLIKRPMKPYYDIFKKCGVSVKTGADNIKTKGQLKSGRFEIAGDISSQFISGLLFALPLLDGDSELIVTGSVESIGYIDLTIEMLKRFGIEIESNNYTSYKIKGGQVYKPQDVKIEADYSQAAFFLCAGALGCDIECIGLSEDSLQGDREIIEIIERAGGKIERTADGIKARHTTNMHGIDIDARNIPDLVPIVAVMLSFLKGESNIVNAGRLRMKESDRLSAICEELTQLGADITEGSDFLKINGMQTMNCATVSARGDHRIAMALSIAACRCEGDEVIISGGRTAVRKSYPDFFEVYNSLK